MKPIRSTLIFFVALFGAAPLALASNLPACPSDKSAYWHNCVGTYTFAGGDKYVGEFRDGELSGRGTYTGANGDKYVGEFRDAKRNGQGTYTFSPNSKFAGDKYVGEYKDDKRNGKGIYTFADGDTYAGEFRDGKYHGQGTYTYADGTKFVGEYMDDKRHGQFTVTYANGDKYIGEFRDGKKNGQGTYTRSDGVEDVGTFKDGVLNGYAVRYLSDGTIQMQGIWKNDRFQYHQDSSSTPSLAEMRKTEMLTYLLTFLPSFLILFGILKSDKIPEPPKLLASAFILGFLLCLPAGKLNYLLIDKSNDPEFYSFLAGFTEETLKFIGIFLFFWDRVEFDEPIDAVIYGTLISLGFATFENYEYVYVYPQDLAQDLTRFSVALDRAVTAIPMHACCGVLMGFLIGRYMASSNKKFIAFALLIPVAVHAGYNFTITVSGFVFHYTLAVVLITLVFFRKISREQKGLSSMADKL